MDSARILGFGLSILFGFARWRFPSVNKVFASCGMALGFGLIIWSLMPFVKYGPGTLAIACVVGLVGAAEWHSFQREAEQRQVKAAKEKASERPHPRQLEPDKPLSPEKAAGHPAEPVPQALPPKRAPAASSKQPPVPADRTTQPDQIAQRAAILNQLTQLYILSNDGISPRMMAGMELPPADFLNDELEKQGAKWRVRNVNGPSAETYELP